MKNHRKEHLVRVCSHALRYNLALRRGEHVVVLNDARTAVLGWVFETAARSLTPRVVRCEIPVPQRNGEEPPRSSAAAICAADVVVLAVTRSLSWTHARMRAVQAGARLVSLPGLTEDVVLDTFEIDYEPIRERVNRLCDILDGGGEVRIRTRAGTDLRLGIGSREAHGRKGGLYRSPGEWGNLPCGEAFIAPIEGSAEGVYVVDASHGGVGLVREPVRVTVRDGRAVRLDGGEESVLLREQLESVGDPAAFTVAELGVGCNCGVRLCGVPLVDEKVLGTCHIALGANAFFGGKVDVGIHLDGIIRAPSIWIDGRPVMEEGRLSGLP